MSLKMALVQMKVAASKLLNLSNAERLVAEACQRNKGIDMVVLPEIFNSSYDVNLFRQNAEVIPGGESWRLLSRLAGELGVWIVGGSIPELADGGKKVYNSCMVFNRKGDLAAVHRKVHLFDIDIPGKISFKESETLSPGNSLTSVSTEFGTLGIGICYDLRFPELTASVARSFSDTVCMIYPGAFNMTTGPLHWE